MVRVVPAYYLALSLGNIAVLTFAWGKLAVPIIVPRKRESGRLLGPVMGMSKVILGPFPRG